MPCKYGTMLFLTGDKYIGGSLEHYGEYCDSEAEVFGQILDKGQVAIEVGANIGAHTVHLSQLVGESGHVIAFEPQMTIYHILCANISLNEAFNVRTYHGGAGDQFGKLKVPEIDYHLPDSNFGAVSLLDVEYGEQVSIIPLDSLELPSLRLLKIDVEGMEIAVIKGARAQIERHRPVLYVENDRRGMSSSLITEIRGLGYNLWWHLAPLFNPFNFREKVEDIFHKTVSINLICIPKEQGEDVTGFPKVQDQNDWWENHLT